MSSSKTDLQRLNQPQTLQASPLQVEQSRAVAEVQSAMQIAKMFPRNEVSAAQQILNECRRPELAEGAQYTYPRGGTRVTGPSIRLAEICAQKWGNLDYGVIEIDRREGESSMIAYCIDLETNTRAKREFVVPHKRTKGKNSYTLDDPRDIYEMTANQGARRLRACILSIIPGHIVTKAIEQCNQTLAGNSKEPLADRALKIVSAFEQFGVDDKAIEKRLGHSIKAISEQELVNLRGIYNSLRDDQSKRDDWFPRDDVDKAKSKLDEAKAKIEKLKDKTQTDENPKS